MASARVFTHLWLALFGLWSWEDVPALPPEIVLLPSWLPLNIYDFACWARQTIVALSLVKTHRPVARAAVRPRRAARRALAVRSRAPGCAARALAGARGPRAARLRAPAAAPAAADRARARRALDRAPPGGRRLLGRHPAAVGLLADRAAPVRLPARSPGDAPRPGGPRRLHGRGPRRLPRGRRPGRAEPAPGSLPVARVGHGAGADRAERRRPGRRPSRRWLRAADWLLGEEVTVPGDWSVARPHLAPGGWAFEFANVNYPDVDDTAEVVLALRRAVRRRASRSAIARAARWVEGMQSSDGGWGAFDAENTRTLVRELPFLDFGEVIDEPSADVTAHALEMLAELGPARHAGRAARAALAARAAGGRRIVVRALGRQPRLRHRRRRAGADRRRRRSRRAVHPARRALAARAPERRRRLGRGSRAPTTRRSGSGAAPSTASQTAWALLALHAAGERSQALERGVRLARGDPARRRRLGRAAVHRHRLSLRLLHQLPPLPARLSDHGARTLPAMMLLADAAPRRRAERSRGDGARRGRELPGRQPGAAARARASTCSPSTASRGWSTNSATRRPATASPRWTGWRESSSAPSTAPPSTR